jgi:hypothetical protein
MASTKRVKDTFKVTGNTRIGALLTLMEVEKSHGARGLAFVLTPDRHWEIRAKNFGKKPILEGTVLDTEGD